MASRLVSVFAVWLAVVIGTNAMTQTQREEIDRVSHDVSTYPYHRDFKTCPISIDIAYMIDGSDSISAGNFELQKTVVKVMAYFFGVMRLGTHEAVITYGGDASAPIKFLDHTEFNPFRDAVKDLTKPNGNTRMDRGIEVANDEVFGDNGGARVSQKIPKILVIFTDGVTGGQQFDIAIQQLVNKNIIVFVVGIGNNLDVNALRDLTPRDDLVYTATDFLDLYIKAGFIARQICQHAQYRGDMGQTGPQGPDGPQGPQGPVGDPGEPGDRGNRGSTGAKGFKGAEGPQGISGGPGLPAAKGYTGPQGNQGPKGQRGGPGAEGSRGPAGDEGNDGDTGPRGAKGLQGPSGPGGDAGDDGANGNSGNNGVPGDKGMKGDVGPVGDPGAPGADQTHGGTGAKGQPGDAGPDGPSGVTGSPGPKGDPGPRGPKGDRGATGSAGNPGQDGTPGADGDPGVAGSPGSRGSGGDPGAQGPNGARGNDGVDGLPGPRGPTGPDGSDGSDADQVIACIHRQSATGQLSMSCSDFSYTATDCGCSRGCGEWAISNDGQTCTCKCNTYVPSSFYSVGVRCCRLE